MYKYKIGDVVTGRVTGIENYGIFLSFSDGTSGLIHISEISDHFVRNINDYAKIGEYIKVKVIGIDENNHYKLSIKNMVSRKDRKLEKIIETSKGFSTIAEMLPKWVESKTLEIENKKEKN